MINKKGQIELRLILGIFVIMFGVLGIGTLGVGIILNNNILVWFGGILTALIGIIVSTIQEFIK
ncbi:MAG TPA: hypothetical protein VJH65_00340 [Candidatus Nanoarchaeia archaeon]|nr:hypothetical protein [Candidatus Nanoarchaeia archaeon]